MTLITFEDGKPLMKEDGKIGTEQACCCAEEPCTCQTVLPAGCEVDYIAVTLEFRFDNCGNGLAAHEFLLDDDNGFSQTVEPMLDENGNEYQVEVNLQCVSGQYNIEWSIDTMRNLGCFSICSGNQSIGGLSRRFPIVTQTYKGFCCPAAIDSYEWDGENGLCPGAHIAVTDITIVLA